MKKQCKHKNLIVTRYDVEFEGYDVKGYYTGTIEASEFYCPDCKKRRINDEWGKKIYKK